MVVAALLGAPAGLLTGLWLVARRRVPHWPVLRRSLAALAGLVALAIMGAAVTFQATGEREIEARVLEFEIRLPAGVSVPADGPTGSSYAIDRIDVSIVYGNQQYSGFFPTGWLRREGDRPVIAGGISLRSRGIPSAVVLSLPGQPFRQFALDFAAEPVMTDGLGAWRRVDAIRAPGEPAWQPAEPHDVTELRFRIARDRR